MNAAVWALDMNLTIIYLFFFFKHLALTVEFFVKTVPSTVSPFTKVPLGQKVQIFSFKYE